MPTHSLSQASAQSSGKPAQPSADAPPSALGAAPGNAARKVTLFHVLVERGWDAELAYTADQRVHAMTSETVAASLQPVMDELRQIRETMAGFATKAELRQIREDMATKADLADLRREFREFRTDFRREAAERETRLVKWVFGAMLAQTAVIVALVTLLK